VARNGETRQAAKWLIINEKPAALLRLSDMKRGEMTWWQMKCQAK